MSMNISSTDCSSYRILANSLIDTGPVIKHSLEEGIRGYVVLNNSDTLKDSLDYFKSSLPKLPLWERFKDLFGLSESAENQRILSTLFAMGMFYKVCRCENLPDDRYQQVLSGFRHELENVGLASHNGKQTLTSMTADIAASLLRERPALYGDCVLLHQARLVIDEGRVKLQGYLSITGLDNALCLLPFETQEETTGLLYEFMSSSPTARFQLLNDFFSGRQFAEIFPLIRPADPKRNTVKSVQNWENLATEYQVKRGADEHQDVAVLMPEMMFTHGESSIGAESRMTFDIHRANLLKADVTVNGRGLSRGTVEKMHRIALEIAQNAGIAQTEYGNLISQAWTRLLVVELEDPRKASRLAGALIYACYQGGAGTGTVKMLANMGPKHPELIGKYEINVDITGKNTQVRQTLSSSVCANAHQPEPSEFRFGGVHYTLPHSPAQETRTAIQTAADYLDGDVKVTGMGVNLQLETLLTDLF